MAKRYESSLAVRVTGADMGPANTSQQLAETLRSFTRAGTGLLRERQARRGAEAGAAATGSTPALRKPFSAFNRAYNDAALRNYVISQHADAESELSRIEAEAGNDPEKFRALSDGALRGAVKAALPEARAEVSEFYHRRFAEGVARIEGLQRTEQRAANRAALSQELTITTDSISRKLASGDLALMAQAPEEELRYQLMVDGAVASGDITAAEGIVLHSEAAKRITQETVYGHFELEMRRGDPIAFIGRVTTQPIENLSDDEKQALIGGLYQRLARHNALREETERRDTVSQRQRWNDGERAATVGVLRREMTASDIVRMVDDDELDPTVGRVLVENLSSPINEVDDPELLFQVETSLLAHEESDIAGMGNLSHATRAALIERRRKETEGWQSDQRAQEAMRRIDVALGVPSGLGPQHIVNVSPDDAKAAANARSYFYDLVEATPEEERKVKYFELANRVIADAKNESGIAKQLRDAQHRLTQFQQEVRETESGARVTLSDEQVAAADETITRYKAEIAELESQLQQLGSN